MLAACTSDDGQQQTVSVPQPAVCNGPIVEISGADPRFEPLNATANQDYQRDGKSYKIVQDPSRFSQAGLAAIYDAEPGSNLTASGEAFDPTQLTAAHPTLPIPSYARITNLANGRMIVVRINDRGPYGNDRVISLSRAAADRLNTSNNTKVRIDPIIVAQDGSLSGPGMACTTVAKQTYALPAPPDLSGGAGTSSVPVPQGDILPVSNSTLKKRRSDRRAGNQQRFPRRTNDLSAWCTGRQRTDACATARCYSSVDNACNLTCNGDTASRLAKRQRQLYGASRGR
ncbi:rare lipoprotein A [Escherichia coli]|uniref:Endolytic peptidoglycan transglycosylase RlpA n=1 Tax=Escherichia coli TaxID=562 RepID=A0A377KAT7_ECOLX|nr:rare lipoprotein A [Escherichia coli]